MGYNDIYSVLAGALKFYVVEYPAAANPYLAVPTPVVSVATTPVFDTKLVIERLLLLYPYPNTARSPP